VRIEHQDAVLDRHWEKRAEEWFQVYRTAAEGVGGNLENTATGPIEKHAVIFRETRGRGVAGWAIAIGKDIILEPMSWIIVLIRVHHPTHLVGVRQDVRLLPQIDDDSVSATSSVAPRRRAAAVEAGREQGRADREFREVREIGVRQSWHMA
jgi:hypothetical protein